MLGGDNINRFLNDKKTVLLKLDSKGGVTWFKEYLEGRVYVVSECDDGGYVFVYREEDGSFDQTWFVKVAPDGEIDWRKTATHTEVSKSGTLYCLKKTSDGNFIAAGSWTSFVWVVKMSFSGGLLWNALYGGLDGNGSGVYDIIETNDGGLAFTGTSADRRIFVAKVAAFPEDYHNEANVLESVWYCSYGPYTVSSVIPADDGGFVVAGQTAVLKHVDRGSIWVDKASLLLKVNAYGIEEWRKTFESISFENIETLVQANDGGYVLFGYARESNNSRQVFAVVKTDSMGNLEWHHEYRDNDYYCVMKSAIKTSDGGYAFAGTGHGNTSYEHLVLFYKIRASGNVQWTKQFKKDESQFAPLIVETDDGGFLVAYDLDKYARLKKVTANGVNQWIQEYTDAWLKVYCLAKSSTGGYLLAGGRATSKQYGESIAWIAKTDENGVVQWQKTFVLSGEYDPHRFNHFTGVYSTTDGGFILLAAQHSYSNWVLKIDSSGNLEWSQRLTSTPDQYYVTSVCVGDDNRLVIAGQVNERNIWLGKTGYTITVEKPVEGDNSSTSPQDSVDNGLLSNVSLFDLTVIATVTVVALATITYLFRKHRLTKQSTKQ